MVVAFFSLVAYTTQAQTAASTIKGDRQRISKGVKSGEHTKAETARLAAKSSWLKNEKEVYKTNSERTAEETKDTSKIKRKSVREFITKSIKDNPARKHKII